MSGGAFSAVASLWCLPLGAAGVSHGIYTSYTRTRMPTVPLRYPDLPADLEGLKILHLSDMHIGPYVQLADLEALLARVVQAAPDLIAITGDVCDHNPDYLATLRLIESVPTRLGTYASLGNHEYMRGIRRIRRNFDKTEIPLLVNEGLAVPVGAATLYLGGVDDPRFLRSPASYAQLRNSVGKGRKRVAERCLHRAVEPPLASPRLRRTARRH